MQDPIVAGVEDKLATWTFLPKGMWHGGKLFESLKHFFSRFLSTS